MKRSQFNNKTEIHRRIQRLASEFWELKDKNLSNIDPVVNFLIGAISEELAKLGNEISEIRHGLVDEISASLLPKEFIGAKPAHGIVHAMPNDLSAKLDRNHQFKTSVQALGDISNSQNDKEIYLSPIGEFPLNSLRVERIINYAGFWEWDGQRFDIDSNVDIKTPRDTFIIGLSASEEIDYSAFVDLFFYHEDATMHGSIIDELELLSADIDEHVFETGRKPKPNLSDESAIRSFITVSHMQEQEISDLYGPFYSRVNLSLNMRNWREKSSLFMNKEFAEKSVDAAADQFYWLRFRSSNPNALEILKGLRCQTNCFPVMNRRYREFSYRTNGYFNILNLPGTDEFYDIEEIRSTSGRKYESTSMVQTSVEESFGFYEIRSQRTGRLDENEVMNKLNYLIDLLRDESSAFSALDYNFLNVHLRTLNQNIELLRQKIPQSHKPTNNTYLILNCKEEIDNVFIKFWTTEGEWANSVTSNNELLPVDNYDIDDDSIAIISAPKMGRNLLSPDERLRKLQWHLTSKDGIYSREDIRKFCLSKSRAISDVEIKYITKLHKEAQKGAQKVIQVVLVPELRQKLEAEEKENTRLEIEKGIEYKSLLAFPAEVRWRT